MNKKVIVTSIEILDDVFNKNIPFAIVIKQKLKKLNVKDDIKKVISTLVGCELRHHLIFKEISDDFFKDIDNLSMYLIYLAHANNLFIKYFDFDDMVNYVYESLKEKGYTFDKKDIVNYFTLKNDTKKLIPDKYDVNSNEFLSLRFNTPSWLVKMWNKNYGRSLTLKILKANSKAPINTYRVNTILTTTEEVINSTEFTKAFIEDVVIYQGKDNIRNNSLYTSNEIFHQKMGFKYIVDKFDIDPLRGIAIYQGGSSNFYLEVALRGQLATPIDLIMSSHQDFYDTRNNVPKFGIKNLKTYLAEPSSIVTCVSKKVNTFFVLPRSSNFELLRSTPDYFARFKRESLDNLINEQYIALSETKDLIEEGGNLVYIISTLCNKEGHGNIYRFLKENPNFKLVEERQLFPFDPYDSSIYYAILRKDVSNED